MQSNYQIVAASLPAFASVRSEITAAQGAREARSERRGRPRLVSAISLREVCFSYGRGNVLDGVSDDAARRVVRSLWSALRALGKTTIADLIIGLLRPQRGEVWIDGFADARHRRNGVARHDRICAAGYVPLPRHGLRQRRAGRARHFPCGGGDSAAPRRGLGIRPPHCRRAWTLRSASGARGFPTARDSASPSPGALVRDPALLVPGPKPRPRWTRRRRRESWRPSGSWPAKLRCCRPLTSRQCSARRTSSIGWKTARLRSWPRMSRAAMRANRQRRLAGLSRSWYSRHEMIPEPVSVPL